MRTTLYKVTTWQGKTAIRNPENITNKFFHYLYFLSSPSQNTSKDAYEINPIWDQGIDPINTFCVTERKKKLGRRLPRKSLAESEKSLQ